MVDRRETFQIAEEQQVSNKFRLTSYAVKSQLTGHPNGYTSLRQRGGHGLSGFESFSLFHPLTFISARRISGVSMSILACQKNVMLRRTLVNYI